MRKLICVIILILPISLVYAQQDPQFSMNMFNLVAVHPAYSGSQGCICASAINRQQWVGFDNAPVTTVFNVEAPLSFAGTQHGIGLTIVSDKLGFEKNNSIRLNYSFHHAMEKGLLNFGISLGLQNNSLKGQWYVPEGDNFVDPSQDDLLKDSQVDGGQMVFDLGFGLFYLRDHFYIGASVAHLNQPQFKYGTSTMMYLSRHYYLSGGYSIDLTPKFELKPSVHFKSDGKSSQIDLNTNIVYNKTVWGGVSYRIDDAMVALLGLQFRNGIKIGYSFDISTSKIAKSSHEFLLSYCFNTKMESRNQIYKSIRFL